VSEESSIHRVYFVLARDVFAADRVCLQLVLLGLPQHQVRYLTRVSQLCNVSPDKVCFIYADGHAEHHLAKELRAAVDSFCKFGAIVRTLKDVSEDRGRHEAEELVGSSKDPAAAMWERLEATPPEPEDPGPVYKQIYLGGPMHGRRRSAGLADKIDADELVISVTGLVGDPDKPQMITMRYEPWTAWVLGQPIRFWIYQPAWNERQSLVRNYLLGPVER